MDNPENAKKSKKRSRSLIPDESKLKNEKTLKKRSSSKQPPSENGVEKASSADSNVAVKQLPNDKKKPIVPKSVDKNKENSTLVVGNKIFGLSDVEKQFFKENFVSLSIIEQQQSVLQNCQIITLANTTALTDAFFWTLKDLSSGYNKSVTEICCVNCVNLSDGAVYCIVDFFKNLKKIQLDGCSKISERSAVAFHDLSANMLKISMKKTNVTLISKNILNSLEKYDFNGCPVESGLTLITKENSSMKKCYKIVMLIDWNSTKPKEKKQKNQVSFNSTLVEDKLMNIFECDYSLGHLFVSPGTIVIGLSDKKEHKEEAAWLATHLGLGSPCINVGDKIFQQLAEKLQTKISLLKLKFNEMRFIDQQMFSNLRNTFYLLSRQPNETKQTSEQIRNFGSEIYKTAAEFVDKNFPEINDLSTTDLDEIMNEIKSNSAKFLPVTNEFTAQLLHRQGHAFRLGNETPLLCSAETFVNMVNSFFDFKNIEKSTKLVPWLSENAVVAKMLPIKMYLTKLSGNKDWADEIYQGFFDKGLFIKLNHPWLNSITLSPVLLYPTYLPNVPPTDMKSIWNNYPAESEMEIFAKFVFCTRPSFNFNVKLFQLLCRIGNPVVMWQNGVLFHFGFVEAYVSFSSENDQDLLKICLRTLCLGEKEQKTWEEYNGFANIVQLLRYCFRLLRQFVIVTIQECGLHVEEYVRCKKCPLQQKEHYFQIQNNDPSSTKPLTCGDTVYEVTEFGYGYPLLGCDSHGACDDRDHVNIKCTLCFEGFVNNPVAWCDKCGQCAECTLLLMKQCLYLNGVDLSQKTDFDLYAQIFTKNSGPPIIVEFQCSNSSSFEITPFNNLQKIYISVMDGRRFHVPLSNCARIGEAISLTAQNKNSTTFINIRSPVLTDKIEIQEEKFFFHLILYEKETSVAVQSNEPLKTKTIPLQIGMRLEAKDRKNPSLICVASITDFDNEGNVLIHFDGWSTGYDYYTSIDNEDLHPVGYCESVNYKLEVPGPQAVEDRSDFTWSAYLARYLYQQVPHKFFHSQQHNGSPEMEVKVDEQQATEGMNLNKMLTVGMKLEVKLKNSDDTFAIATIKLIKKDKITIVYDGPNETEELVCDRYDPNLRPIGFCQSTGCQLFEGNKLQSNFDWLNYFIITMSKPVPFEFFTKDQTLSIDKPIVYSYIKQLSNLPKCTTTLSMNYCTYDFTSLDTKSLASAVFKSANSSENNATFAFGLLPVLKNVNEMLYPNLRLAYKFDIDEQNVCTFAIKSDKFHSFFFSKDSTNRPVMDSVAEKLIKPCLLQNSLTPMASVVKKKPGESDSFAFLKRCQAEFKECLSLLVRTKIELATSVPELFPNFDVDSDQKAEKFGMKEKIKISLYNKISEESLNRILSRQFVVNERIDFGQELKKYEISDHIKSIVSCKIDYTFNRPLYQTIIDKSLSLSEISLTNCRLTNFDFENAADSTLLKILLKFNLSYNPLKQIPSSVFEMTNLRELRLAACGLVEYMPMELLQLKQLTVLDLSYNFFKQPLPDYIVRFQRMQNLDLSAVPYFPADNLPITLEVITNFCHRFYLPSFEGVSETNVMEKLAQLTGITSMPVKFEEDLAKLNQLINREAPRFESTSSTGKEELGHGFPLVLCQIKYLTALSLAYHNIAKIPPEIERLSMLEELNFTCCPYLEEISERLAMLLYINQLQFKYCSALKDIDSETLEKGTTHIMGHLRRKLAGSADCKRTKLMMVGLGGAGKSTLVQALIGGTTYSWQQQIEVTDGIEITEYSWKIDEETIVFSIWDFAGQSVYYHTHQFFLSNRAIYLLLWNSRLGYEHAGLEFWLSSIACHAPKAPVFVVATFGDLIDKINLPKDELQNTFPQIVSFERVSAISGLGMEDFRERLEKVALSQGYMNSQVDAVYLQLEAVVLKKRDETPIISFSELEEHAKALGLFHTSEVRKAAMFLNELGSIQYFSNEFLRDRVVISPQWLVDVMACVVTVKSSIIEDGTFKEEDINQIWEKYPEELRPWLLKLTEEYDLTFKLPPPNENLHVVPCLLPEEEPKVQKYFYDKNREAHGKLDWPKITDKATREICMGYKFDYLPAGLFNRIQSRLCQFSNGSTIWKSGSLLNKNNHLALIRQNKDERLMIQVQGLRPENVMFLIHEVIITIINESFKGVTYEILIQCPDCVNSKQPDPHMFSSVLISSATTRKAPILQCMKSFHMCSLNSLHSALPPNSMVDYEQQLLKTMQEANDLRSSVVSDVGMLVCSENIRQPGQLCPTKIVQDLEVQGIKIDLIKPTDKIKLDDVVMKLVNSKLLVVCMSEEFCKNQMCTDLLSYVQQSHKQIVAIVVGQGKDWKLNSAGMLLGSELYIDFQKTEVYEMKFKELLSRIRNRKKSQESVEKPPVFFSYCWANSHDAVKKGHRTDQRGLGEVDPRDIHEFLKSKKINCWIDYHMTGQKALFEEIAEALRNARLMIACVSDDYLESQNCLREFHFAVGTLKLPTILCIVGTGDNWQESELTLLAYKSPRIDFQKKSDVAKNALLDIVKQNLTKNSDADANKKSADNSPEDESNGYDEYRELCELMRRRFMSQIGQIDLKIRSGVIQFKIPYPRLIFLDLRPGDPDLEGCQYQSLTQFAMSKFCLNLLCEYEGGWHMVGEPMTLSATVGYDTLEDIINKTACYQLHLLNIIQYSNFLVEFLKLDNSELLLNDLKYRSKKYGSDSLEASYKFVTELARNNDEQMTRGNMHRYSLYSRKAVWLCSEHGKSARGMLTDEDVDLEDITISLDGKSTRAASAAVVDVPSSARQEQIKDTDEMIIKDSELRSTGLMDYESKKSGLTNHLEKLKQKSRLCNVM